MFKNYIGTRKFYKELFIVIIPIIIQFFIQNFINFLDNFMVGQLGEDEIASVAVANQYYKLFYPAVVSICTAASIFTAQYFGSKREEKLQKMFGIKLTFSLMVTAIFIVIGMIFTKPIIIYFLQGNESAVSLGVSYLQIALWSYIPIGISTAFTFTFRPLGLTKVPMIASSVGMVVNLILNYFLIYGNWFFPRLGVEGAAIGTLVARIIELAIFLVIYLKHDFIFKTNFFHYFKIDFELASKTVRKIIPLFINEMAYTLALIAIFKVYSERGTGAISAINIADIVSQVVFILASGTGTATSILVGYKLGSNQLEEAERNANYLLGYAVFMGVIIMAVISVFGVIVPQFYNISEATKQLTIYAILIQGAVAPIMMFTRIPFFVLRSGGRVLEIVFLDSLFMWVVKVPVALIVGYHFKADLIFIYLAVESTRLLNAFVSMMFYKKKRWLRNLSEE
jgi:putative MATE family efflux protein